MSLRHLSSSSSPHRHTEQLSSRGPVFHLQTLTSASYFAPSPPTIQLPLQRTATMPGPYTVQVHQAPTEPSVGSSYTASYASSLASSSSVASSPRSGSPATFRVYGAGKSIHLTEPSCAAVLTWSAGDHTAKKAQLSTVDVVQYGTTGFQPGSPSPGYTGTYSRK